MTAFLTALLAATVIGSLIWLLLTLLKPLTQKVFSQSWHYYVGLTPAFFLTGVAWAISTGVNFIIASITTNTPVISESSSTGVAPPSFVYNYGGAGGVIEKTGETVAKARLSIETFAPIILAVWLIGTLVFIALKMRAYIRFRHGISLIGRPSTGTDCNLPVLVCPCVATPMLVGVFKPVIVLPEHDYSERELVLILSHETAHWRRGDMFIKLLLLIVNALHWFNPLVYRMNMETARLCENACDETLVKNMDKTERVLYGELILSTVAYEKAPALCSAMSEGANLKRRLLYMLNGKKMKRPVMVLAIMAAFVVVAGGVWLALPINSAAAYGEENAEDLTSYEKDDVVAPKREITDDMGLGAIEDEAGILIDGDVAIYVKGRKATHMTIDGYNDWVAAGENDADVYDYAECVIYTPIGKGPDEQMYMRVVDYKAWAAAGENDADVYDYAEKLNSPELVEAQPDEKLGAPKLVETQSDEKLGAPELSDAQDVQFDEMPDGTYLWPLAGYTRISAQFGPRIHPIEETMFSHDGIDIAAQGGTPILAAKAGTISEIGENSADGLYVILDHGAGMNTFYAHMKGYVEGIAKGDSVDKGDIIGYVGSTGESTGNHLHFGISADGVYINPLEGFDQ